MISSNQYSVDYIMFERTALENRVYSAQEKEQRLKETKTEKKNQGNKSP